MVPFLLPFSIGLMIALAIGLVLFLRFYQVPRPGTALTVRRAGKEPSLLLGRGAFVGGAERVDTIDLTERSLSLEVEAPFLDGARKVALDVSVRPSDAPADVLALAAAYPAEVLGDVRRLESALRPALSDALAAFASKRSFGEARAAEGAVALESELAAKLPLFRVERCALSDV
ncbi:MAG: hypothetical protein IPM79_31375 [Polyangiaceae bacterium]|nr:hypothetical protein [Polyangiaceae bacterium]